MSSQMNKISTQINKSFMLKSKSFNEKTKGLERDSSFVRMTSGWKWIGISLLF